MEWYESLYTTDFAELCGFGDSEQSESEAVFVADVLDLTPESRLLDLCCGYGRHSFAIAEKSGCSVTGLDLSAEFIEVANEKYASPLTDYVRGDMREIPYSEQFDSVTNLFTSFGFFPDDEENEQVLTQVNRALKPNGMFLLDYENKFNFVINDVLKGGRSWRRVDENTVCLISNVYDVMNEREVFSATIKAEGRDDVTVGYDIRLYSLPELKRMLTRNGFELVQVWGDFDKSEYSVHSRRLITLSRKVA